MCPGYRRATLGRQLVVNYVVMIAQSEDCGRGFSAPAAAANNKTDRSF